MEALSKNKWKYSTIGLLAVLAIGFTFPQTVAAASVTLKDIFTKLTTVDGKVDQIKANTDSIKDGMDDLQAAIESTHYAQSFDETLSPANDKLTILKDTYPMGGILKFDVSGTEGLQRLALLCDSGGIYFFDGHHDFPVNCSDKLEFQYSTNPVEANPSVHVTSNFIVTNVDPLP